MRQYTDYKDRRTWLTGRRSGIGASEAGAVLGLSSFMTAQDVYDEKRSRKKIKDDATNAAIEYGTAAEEHLRALFALKHVKDYSVVYHPYRIYRAEDPDGFMTATLDGELVRLSDGKTGIYECKTKMVMNRGAMDDWNGRIPQGYYCQLCHQLYVTGYDFAVLNAELRFQDNTAEIREYTLEREDCAADIEYIVERERKFWGYVQAGEKPPVQMTL